MQEKEKKSKCNWSDEATYRLICAIINSAESDWDTACRSINRKGPNTKDLYQLKQVIDFINSDWFRDLTNHTCDSDAALDLLMKRIKNQKAIDELNQFIKVNKKKWEKKGNYHIVKPVK